MILNLDLNVIVQGTLVLVLIGVARTVFTSSVTIAAVAADLKAHKENDSTLHAEIDKDIRELRGGGVQTRPPNGRWV